MGRILSWNIVDPYDYVYSYEERELEYYIYKLTSLPDFSEERFSYLSKEVDDRASEVAKLQMKMLRHIHSLGTQWSVALRLIKDEDISLYIVFRYSGQTSLSVNEVADVEQKIQTTLMGKEYSFKKDNSLDAIDSSWVSEISEITKEEKEYKGAEYSIPGIEPLKFYVPYSWVGSDNNMEYICTALMNHRGKVAIDITISPTEYLSDEKNWVNGQLSRLKDSYNGETLRNEEGKVIWKGEAIPILKTPLDSCDKTNKQYENSSVFLSSIRVLAEENAGSLSDALLVNSVRQQGKSTVFRKGFGLFDYFVSCYKNVDISAEFHTPYWIMNANTAPYRAQRLNRLVSVEEISNFFRVPIPVHAGFPGFTLDTGLQVFSEKKKALSTIRLGTYMDEVGKANPAEFDSQQFAKHGLIVGVPGSGKTTAMFNILHQLWDTSKEQQIPFIILEPAKTEYRAMKLLPEFRKDMLVFTLGDEGVSPFRFNPMEVLPGIKIENHISKLQACFVGAFDLFDPLPIFLEQAIRRTYEEKGWYEDSVGGEEGLETPTLSDLSRNAEYIVSHSGFDAKMRSDFQASLLERLNSLRRGSKGRMLDTRNSIPPEELMNRPVVLELDSLNGDEKSLLMMFLLTYVYEYCKVMRKSGSPLRHMLFIEEAHNLIPSQIGGSDSRANPKGQTIELFVNMLAEMRALGEGILIADQLPTAIAPQAVKQTNVKVLMRVTAKDDREEIGNSMDLNEEQMHKVVNFKTGHSYLYHEGEDRVRMLRMVNFKGDHDVEEPPSDQELKVLMADYEDDHPELYFPYKECEGICRKCNRRVRNQAESFVRGAMLSRDAELSAAGLSSAYKDINLNLCQLAMAATSREAQRLTERYSFVGEEFGRCVFVHIYNNCDKQMLNCQKTRKWKCDCTDNYRNHYLSTVEKLIKTGGNGNGEN